MAYLQVDNLTKKFSTTDVLKGVSFSLEKGEVLSIIGPSGGGKTTLLRCLNFLISPDSGKMILDGDTILDAELASTYSNDALRKKRLNFGLVFQSFHLFPQYTVRENVMLAPTLLLKDTEKQLKKDGCNKAERKKFLNVAKRENEERCLSLIEQVGLSEKKDFYPYELSGGQQQRVAIARAMALQPKILCFDEPTSALDPELTGEVLRVIRELKNVTDMTMIIVTHEMEFAKEVSDKVIFMSDGMAAECGTPDEVFYHPQSNKLKQFLSRSLK